MARSDKLQSATQPTRNRRPDARIPHPSWRQTITGADQGAGRVISAGDFWAHLGL